MTAAFYFDGHSARRHEVELGIGDGAVVVIGAGPTRVYPAAQAKLTEPFAHAPAVLYLGDGAHCEVSGAARDEIADALGYRKPRVVRWQERWWASLTALVLLFALILATAIWGVPYAADKIASRLPESLDMSLGRSALTGLQRRGWLEETRFSDERVAEIRAVMESVVPSHPRVPIRLLVQASDKFGPNALALPDGTIVVTDDMVRNILGESQEFDPEQKAQLAGVLAHEIGHIEHRHSARTLARTSLMAALSATLFGDFSAVAAGVPALLMNLTYSREMETEADSYAIAVLQGKKLPLEPLADLLEYLDDVTAPRAGWLSKSAAYASSHPATSERIARLRNADQPATPPSSTPPSRAPSAPGRPGRSAESGR